MKLDHVELLACVDCGGEISSSRVESQGEQVINALLACQRCGRHYAVLDGVGLFIRQEDWNAYIKPWEAERMRRLGFEAALPKESPPTQNAQVRGIHIYEHQHEEVFHWEDAAQPGQYHSGEMFWRFIPLDAPALRGQTLYVACVGRGKEVRHLMQADPGLLIVAELGAEVHGIPKLFPNDRERLLVLRCDASHPPLKPACVDAAICDHALQHVANHRLAFSRFAQLAKPGGAVSVCVYSWENNFLMTHLVEPAKGLLTRLPLGLVRALALLPSMAIILAIRLIYLPVHRLLPKLSRHLPLSEHMLFWAPNPFRFIWMSCYDLLNAPVSYHFRESELREMAQENGLEVERLIHTHGTTWSLVARRHAPAEGHVTVR